ncbi:uncharacterized protein (DUF305 family) [Sphingomonas kaistensis]|uniref:Uncharacterized protein (DUF305 family) n=2 Tax=Sphingomonas TaxID=13687 RepID=A0A7X5Y823_9SPHN|nr:DUF305 domain-containing protein [Sphingomonas kaistensis]NJC05605.1 uncharacterized protein (DUF305 family) [Sphingomonas kaistensis]
MNKVTKFTALLMATAGLAACGSQADNQVAANEPAMDANMAAGNSMQMSGPFAEAEMRMDEQMMAAVGSDVGQNWLKKMIVHHQGAIDMSRIVLDQNPTADVAKMARETIAKQGKEIEDLQKLVQKGAPDQRSAELYRPAMMDMHQKMMAASGSDVSQTYMRKMLEHHKGAVAMSDVALANGVTGTLRSQIQKTRADQQKEIAMVEAMLRGEPMQSAMQQSGAKTAAQAKAEPAPTDTAKAEPKAQPKATSAARPAEPKASAAPPAKAEPAPAASTCAPEHRAAGHC